MVGTWHYLPFAFGKTHRMYNIKSDPPNVNYRLQLVIMYQYWLISCNSYAPLKQDVSNKGNLCREGVEEKKRGYKECSVLSAQLFCKPINYPKK